MKPSFWIVVATICLATGAFADEILLPVFALNVEASGGSVWSSEVYVTNPGPTATTVHIGSLIEGARSDTPPCLPIVQPFLEVPGESTRLIDQGDLSLAAGCPEWAWGALVFLSDDPVVITSRMVNTGVIRIPEGTLLSGFGQEIDGVPLEQLLESGRTYILPGVTWHPNSCGPRGFDTNVFVVNPGDAPIDVEVRPEPGAPDDIVIDGRRVSSPHRVSVAPRAVRMFRLAGPDPDTDDCRLPVVGSFRIVVTGSATVTGSVVDRSTNDARTITPVVSHVSATEKP